jgi:hypothetical protein
MTDRRTPRAFLQSSAVDEDQQELPPCSPMLVEWLEREFPVKLSPKEHPNNILSDQAEQRGQQQVISRLRTLIHQEA